MSPTNDFYSTIENTASAEFKDRGSKFIAYASPVKDAADCKQRLNNVKKLHPKATHHCFAYRIGFSGDNFRASDAGEPSGTAGRPILGQIDSRGLTYVMIIVVRYFGGTLLGTGGLINAYKSAASMVLQLIPVVRKPVESIFKIQFDYTKLNEVLTLIKQTNGRIIKQEIQLFCSLTIAIPNVKLSEFQLKVGSLNLEDGSLVKTGE